MNKKFYFPQFDSIRGFFFLFIFFYHSVHPQFGNDLWSRFLQFSYNQIPLSIEVFFVLSSFLLTLLGLMELSRKGNFSFKKFFARRALRIWPLYYFILAIAFLIIPAIAARFGQTVTLPDWWYYVFFIANFYLLDHVFFLRIFWSLSVEEQFYFVLGCVLKFLHRYLLVIFIFLLGISIAYSLWAIVFQKGFFFNTLHYFFDFAIGGIAAYSYHNKHKLLNGLYNMKGIGRALFYGYLPIHLLVFFGLNLYFPSPYIELLARYSFIIYIGILGVEQLVNNQRSHFLEGNRFLMYTGKISYGLYSFHGLMITLGLLALQKLNWNLAQWQSAIIIFTANYIVGMLSYKFIESPFLKLKKRVQ